MKYYRVVLAVAEGNEAKFEEYLDAFIESETIPDEFKASPGKVNPIQGAYVSEAYGDRQDACGEDFKSKS